MTQLPRIEICGGIASGKTSFARLFKSTGITPLFEDFRANPFWRAFYSCPEFAFETEITFSLQHYHQIRKGLRSKKEVISDYSLILDRAYASVTLSGPRHRACGAVHDQIVRELGFPAILVWLVCDARTELERIRRRNRPEEKSIQLGYLQQLNDAIRRHLSRVSRRVRMIEIDSASRNFVKNMRTRAELRKLVLEATLHRVAY